MYCAETVLFVRIFCQVLSLSSPLTCISLLIPGCSGAVTMKDDEGRFYHFSSVVDIIQAIWLVVAYTAFQMVFRY